MPNKTYKIIELVGTSDVSISQAVENAYRKASETIKNLRWFEVVETRGYFEDGKPHFQVTMKVGFRLEGD